ncbi:MAG: NADH-quinone oxidoreductase subunit J [Bacteroidota bacterium]|nr:NADH-quinone oxidoreductase subunit J [Candidatus Kapabacteria bacterium]MCX7936556.1 NADH-quinone oxidoreductase subunit J [Chlorobiota bacterium]MDW8074749.1 NADH-quinone oxidoreductase subunit J [Bacteroidota bacterium]MDW8271388.1 NADH-quinone oxidoreductase subunit J [Bacteroidota bacterium]
MSLQVALFLLFGIGAIATAIGTITRRNPVAAAVNLIAHFFMLAGLYLTLEAQFLAVLQILVYAGAIMVLVVFVIMLLNLGDEERLREQFTVRKVLGVVIAAILLLQLGVLFNARPTGAQALSPRAAALGTAESVGQALFTQYLFPFEAISLLLLTALVGAIILAKRKVE